MKAHFNFFFIKYSAFPFKFEQQGKIVAISTFSDAIKNKYTLKGTCTPPPWILQNYTGL